MKRFITCLLTLIFTSCHLSIIAQVIPADSSILNYRLIGFSVPEQKGVTGYEFEVLQLTRSGTGAIVETSVFKKRTNTNRLIETVPQFGKTYKWRVNYYKRKKPAGSSDVYSFSTGYSRFVDTSKYRLRVTVNNMRNNARYVFADGSHALYNLEGEALWYLPDIPGVVDETSAIRDIKATNRGTITFLTENNIYEIDYRGKILWQGPNDGAVNGDKAEHYHHEFTRLSNGNYMVCGNETYWAAIPKDADADDNKYRHAKEIDGRYRIPVRCGTLIEYDNKGKVVWQWKSSLMFGDSFLLHADKSKDGSVDPRTHLNGFYFDEKKQNIYLSFRDINSIVKISYPSGKKLAAFGQYGGQTAADGKLPFYGQHCCRVNRKGELYLFNNNTVGNLEKGDASTVIIASESREQKEYFDVNWEFSCDMNDSVKTVSSSGGSVYELHDGLMLVSMGAVNRLFIVAGNKELRWNAFIEAKPVDHWRGVSNYRSSILEDDTILGQLLFAETN